MTDDLTLEYPKFKTQVAALRKASERKYAAYTKAQAVLKEFLKDCPHVELEIKRDYIEGGYYDKSQTREWFQCALCGERGPVTITSGSYA